MVYFLSESSLGIFLLVFYKYLVYLVLIWGSFDQKTKNHHNRAPLSKPHFLNKIVQTQ